MAILGPAHAGGPPWVHPFLSSRRQQVLHAADGTPWAPRFAWSRQLALFARRFAPATAIPRFRLSRRALAQLAADGPALATLEQAEAALGPVLRRWGKGGEEAAG